MASALLIALIAACAMGGAYTLIASALLRRAGRTWVFAFWLATSACLGALGTFRSLRLQRAAGMDLTRVIVPGFYAMVSVAMLLILSVPTAFLTRRASRSEVPISMARRFVAGVASTVGGIIFALAVALVLDLANIPFIPFR